MSEYDIVQEEPEPPKDLESEWYEYLSMRKKIRKPATPKAQQLALRKLDRFSRGNLEIKRAILEKSIERCWEGIFPLNEFDLKDLALDKKCTQAKTYEVEI